MEMFFEFKRETDVAHQLNMHMLKRKAKAKYVCHIVT